MMMRVFLCVTAIVLMTVISTAGAEGLFDMEKMLAVAMPSPGAATGRGVSKESKVEMGSRETYLNFSPEEYEIFGQYLAGTGARVDDYETDGTTITATITARDNRDLYIRPAGKNRCRGISGRNPRGDGTGGGDARGQHPAAGGREHAFPGGGAAALSRQRDGE